MMENTPSVMTKFCHPPYYQLNSFFIGVYMGDDKKMSSKRKVEYKYRLRQKASLVSPQPEASRAQ